MEPASGAQTSAEATRRKDSKKPRVFDMTAIMVAVISNTLGFLAEATRRKDSKKPRVFDMTATMIAYAWKKPRGAPEHSLGDRKSTRLNSSHSQISYAVFCLKKKKKKSSL